MYIKHLPLVYKGEQLFQTGSCVRNIWNLSENGDINEETILEHTLTLK